jgi:hypothetical protein
MFWKKYPPLRSEDVERIFRYLGFELKRQREDSAQFIAVWEGYIDGVRRIITLQLINPMDTYSENQIQTIIENTGITPRRFFLIHEELKNT